MTTTQQARPDGLDSLSDSQLIAELAVETRRVWTLLAALDTLNRRDNLVRERDDLAATVRVLARQLATEQPA